MSTITQRVMTVFGVNNRQALGGLGRMSTAARQTHRAVLDVKSALAGLGVLGAGWGAASFVKGIVKANSSLESLRLQMVSTIQSADKMARGGLSGFDAAFKASAEVIDRLRKEAIESPASMQDMITAFNDVAMGARNAGASYDEIIKLVGNVGTLDKLLGGQGVVGRDVMQLLRGDIGGINTTQLKAVRMEVQKLVKAGDQRGALRVVTEALAVDPKLRAAMGDSFEGRLASAKDMVDEIARIIGGPLFRAASDELKKAYDWVTKHRAEVERVARIWGDRIVKAVKEVWKAAKSVVTVIGSVVESAFKFNEALGGAPALIAMMGLSFTTLARSPGFLKIAAVLELWRQLSSAVNGGEATTADTAKAAAAGGVLGGPWGFLAGGVWGSTRQVVDALGSERRPDSGRLAAGILAVARRIDPDLAAQRIRDAYGVSEYVGGGRWRRRSKFIIDPTATATGDGFFDTSSLAGGAAGGDTKLDFRGSTFRIENRISSDDPSRILSVSLLSAGQAIVQRPLSARFGLGSVSLANGGG